MNIETQTTFFDFDELRDNFVIEPTIYEYFQRANEGNFTEVANLFAPDGCLKPPFDQPIYGRVAIAEYFNKEALDMEFMPVEIEALSSDQYRVNGKVVTAYFSVNVCWLMQLAEEGELMQVEVKLLASLPELANIQPSLT